MVHVLIVEDHEVVRIGLRTLLSLAAGIRVTGEAATATDALARTLELHPEVVLMDIRLPDGSGIDACRQIKTVRPQTRVLFLTSYSDRDTFLAATLAGADGYLLKEIDSEALIRAIHTVGAGGSMLGPEVAGQALERMRSIVNEGSRSERPQLSDLERRILSLISEGKPHGEIEAQFGLSSEALTNHLTMIYDKLRRSAP
jgi:DNA-binding NarL/FixJ family response regulator